MTTNKQAQYTVGQEVALAHRVEALDAGTICTIIQVRAATTGWWYLVQGPGGYCCWCHETTLAGVQTSFLEMLH